jgi:Putative transposase/Transposase zinc-binding domain
MTVSSGPRLEVDEILRTHGDTYRARHSISPEQATVLRRLTACRTAALGGHVDTCDACGTVQISYNSCRDRHCPKCQSTRQIAWVQSRLARLLPTPYFHVVFTLPEQLQPLGLKNRRALYDLLFRAASETLLQLAADSRRLGAQIGATAVLHTWGQNLLFHPHLHCVVTGGGLSPDGQRWVVGREDYFLPVRVLGELFRGKFLAGLKKAYRAGQLTLVGSVESLSDPTEFRKLLGTLYRQRWVVYAKPPFGGAEQVYRYLGRYTHRIAISNGRLVSLEQGRVTFRYKDYADGARWKEMRLDAEEFIRRFLLHVLPKSFVRIRHYGLMAGRNVDTKLAASRQLLGVDAAPANVESASGTEPAVTDQDVAGQEHLRCPHCRGPLRRRELPPPYLNMASAPAPRRLTVILDSS